MHEFTHCNLTSLCLGLLLAVGCTSETKTEPETILELAPSVRYISNGNDVQYFPASAEEQLYNQREILEQYKLVRKHQKEKQ